MSVIALLPINVIVCGTFYLYYIISRHLHVNRITKLEPFCKSFLRHTYRKILSTCTCYSHLSVPTPPGFININERTNSSLLLEWPTPDSMKGAPNISYHITYQREGGEVQNKGLTVNSTELSMLSSGSSYNITVETVGPQNLRSEVVRNSAFTRKYSR